MDAFLGWLFAPFSQIMSRACNELSLNAYEFRFQEILTDFWCILFISLSLCIDDGAGMALVMMIWSLEWSYSPVNHTHTDDHRWKRLNYSNDGCLQYV